MRKFLIHTKNGNQIITEEEAIKNAQDQENSGLVPAYSFYDSRKNETITPPGWLIWSTYEDGCGVVYRGTGGSFHLVTGWQGDFIFI